MGMEQDTAQASPPMPSHCYGEGAAEVSSPREGETWESSRCLCKVPVMPPGEAGRRRGGSRVSPPRGKGQGEHQGPGQQCGRSTARQGADALLACWVATGPHPSPGHPLPITHKEEVGEALLPNALAPTSCNGRRPFLPSRPPTLKILQTESGAGLAAFWLPFVKNKRRGRGRSLAQPRETPLWELLSLAVSPQQP